MNPGSSALAHQIDTMLAFQNKEDIQFRELRSKSQTQVPWATSYGSLAFNWQKFEYRRKPVVPREGYVFEQLLHKHPHDFRSEIASGTCFHVREVMADDE